ncbi:putative protein-tyrosine-phosphatase [Gordonia araii NBRC 100433]|uniref:Tyrosine specific protein phosphatases domain-containing protein n=1 Tax=Gordonia araii NBRC 100433 TaxID=1073574 RepID=G7GXU1_9ACTN|nr:tyrosine-protein phosphatase [Gordonia araii]NNG98388.1 tyrosine-protein phosphatase [Gordonia araii NBRC 100433]GAB08416.1 putative protein-tyrosine-phosphatase [Gordonia araii NBRC 100433]
MPARTAPGAPSPFPSVANFRDLGHWAAADGRVVRPGTVFRANDFAALDADDAAGLTGLRLKTIVDLRTEKERSASPDPAFPGATQVVLDVLADVAEESMPANLHSLLEDPEVARAMSEQMTTAQARDLMVRGYRAFVELDSAKRAFRGFFTHLLTDEPAPMLFHCATGKDRTGWAAATFLHLMGVERADIYRDYLLTNDRLLPALRPLFARFADAGGNPELLRALLGVDETYLAASFAQVADDYGTIDRYFDEALGIDADAQAHLRERFLVSPS